MKTILKTGMTLYILMNMSGIQDLLTDVNQSNEVKSKLCSKRNFIGRFINFFETANEELFKE